MDPVIARAHHGDMHAATHFDDPDDPDHPDQRFGDDPGAWCPMVVLLHVRRDRDDHVDWLLARDAAGAEPLWSFRAAAPPTTAGTEPLGLRLIADHRPRYLTYEGPVSGDRGTVRRLAAGRYRVARRASNRDEDDETHLELAWNDGPPYFVTIGTKSPAAADVPGIDPPPAEHGEEPVRWLRSRRS